MKTYTIGSAKYRIISNGSSYRIQERWFGIWKLVKYESIWKGGLYIPYEYPTFEGAESTINTWRIQCESRQSFLPV